MDEMFKSSVRSGGDLAGVFELDRVSAYFYLYRLNEKEGQKIVDAIKISVGEPPYAESDVAVFWSADEEIVCLRIAGQICAAFDVSTGQKFGGDYVRHRVVSYLPFDVLARLGELSVAH